MPTPPRAGNWIIAGNWKMNTDMTGAVELATGVASGSAALTGVELVLCPPFVFLAAVKSAVASTSVKIGAQNMHNEESGAFTGETSASMLQGLCDYVILGHSERRQLFGETDELVNSKVKLAFEKGLIPVLCVGETLAQREAGQAQETVSKQVREGLEGIVDITGLVVAYEPVWAIGTGQAATPEIAAEVMGGAILETLQGLYPAAAGQIPLLYGGSVNPGNAAAFAAQSSIHGSLVGGAALQADNFLEIARITAEAKAG
ncbi:MAG: triose-phosphate isomerase [SAR202 cluster bacterium Io17-Chloro-G7]|nr:MAG: triose-phosphate isomerase [SAR202 cluster bacterium Io17-Chloro-G7]